MDTHLSISYMLTGVYSTVCIRKSAKNRNDLNFMTAELSNKSQSATYRWALPASRCCVSLFYALPASFAPAARLTIWSWRCLALVASDWMTAAWRQRSSRISSYRFADWWITNRFRVVGHKSPPAGRACNYNENNKTKHVWSWNLVKKVLALKCPI